MTHKALFRQLLCWPFLLYHSAMPSRNLYYHLLSIFLFRGSLFVTYPYISHEIKISMYIHFSNASKYQLKLKRKLSMGLPLMLFSHSTSSMLASSWEMLFNYVSCMLYTFNIMLSFKQLCLYLHVFIKDKSRMNTKT